MSEPNFRPVRDNGTLVCFADSVTGEVQFVIRTHGRKETYIVNPHTLTARPAKRRSSDKV